MGSVTNNKSKKHDKSRPAAPSPAWVVPNEQDEHGEASQYDGSIKPHKDFGGRDLVEATPFGRGQWDMTAETGDEDDMDGNYEVRLNETWFNKQTDEDFRATAVDRARRTVKDQHTLDQVIVAIDKFIARRKRNKSNRFAMNPFIRRLERAVNTAYGLAQDGKTYDHALPTVAEVHASRMCHPMLGIPEAVGGLLIEMGRFDRLGLYKGKPITNLAALAAGGIDAAVASGSKDAAKDNQSSGNKDVAKDNIFKDMVRDNFIMQNDRIDALETNNKLQATQIKQQATQIKQQTTDNITVQKTLKQQATQIASLQAVLKQETTKSSAAKDVANATNDAASSATSVPKGNKITQQDASDKVDYDGPSRLSSPYPVRRRRRPASTLGKSGSTSKSVAEANLKAKRPGDSIDHHSPPPAKKPKKAKSLVDTSITGAKVSLKLEDPEEYVKLEDSEE